MGRPLPGIEAGDRRMREADGSVTVSRRSRWSTESWRSRPGWPSMMRGYLHEEERYRKCFAGGVVSDRRSRQARHRRLLTGSSGARMT